VVYDAMYHMHNLERPQDCGSSHGRGRLFET
jgi:hypothetical protein